MKDNRNQPAARLFCLSVSLCWFVPRGFQRSRAPRLRYSEADPETFASRAAARHQGSEIAGLQRMIYLTWDCQEAQRLCHQPKQEGA